jgi:hypothetical protein
MLNKIMHHALWKNAAAAPATARPAGRRMVEVRQTSHFKIKTDL